MRITFLGTGTSCGVPMLGCRCCVCKSSDSRDKRTRCSLLVETLSTRILIDCGPNFRQQMMDKEFRRIDGLLVTHAHYDHIGGIDDLRPYCKLGRIKVYADCTASESMLRTLPYCFYKEKYPGVPDIQLETISPHALFDVGDITIQPFIVMHGDLPILGYRMGRFAYITDMKTIDDKELDYLNGIDTLIVNALRFEPPHHSHQLVDEAIAFSKRTGAKRTFIIHLSHHIGLHEEVNIVLPEGFELAYDGQIVDID